MKRRYAVPIRSCARAMGSIVKCSRQAGSPTRSDRVALQQLLADHHSLDLRGPLPDQEKRGIAVQALDLVLLRVPIAPVDPKRLLDHLLAGLGGKQLRHPR